MIDLGVYQNAKQHCTGGVGEGRCKNINNIPSFNIFSPRLYGENLKQEFIYRVEIKKIPIYVGLVVFIIMF